jgi:hypothetical protein
MVKKEYKLLLCSALLLLLSSTALAAYLLARIEGPPIVVSPLTVEATLQYSFENNVSAVWDLAAVNATETWYCRLNTTGEGYAGNVSIVWFLEKFDSNSSAWLRFAPLVNVTTTCTLTGLAGQKVYASADGLIANNMNWGNVTDTAGTYRVVAEISKE